MPLKKKHVIELTDKQLETVYNLVCIAQANTVYELNLTRKKTGKVNKSLDKKLDEIRPIYKMLTERKYPNDYKDERESLA